MAAAWEGSTRRARLPRDWPARRRRVLARDRRTCTTCGAPNARQVDHVHPGDDHRIENLTTLCGPCHAAKTAGEGNAARWGRRTRPPEPHPGAIEP